MTWRIPLLLVAGFALTASAAAAAPNTIEPARSSESAERTGDRWAVNGDDCPKPVSYQPIAESGPEPLAAARFVLHQFDGDISDDPVVPVPPGGSDFSGGLLQISQDCTTIYSVVDDRSVETLDVQSGRADVINTALALPGRALPHLLPDGSFVYLRSRISGRTDVVDGLTRSTVWSGEGETRTGLAHAAFSSDGNRVAALGSRDQEVLVFDRSTESTTRIPFPQLQSITNIDMSPDGELLFVAGRDTSPRRWIALLVSWDGTEMETIATEPISVQGGFVNAREVAVCSWSGMVRFTLAGTITATEAFDEITIVGESGSGDRIVNPGNFACIAAFRSRI